MKTSIWIETLEGNHFEISNTVESIIETVEKSNLNIEKLTLYDIIQYDASKRLLSLSDARIIYKSDNVKNSETIINFIHNKLNEKSHLMHEIQVLKKMKDKSIEPLIDKWKKNVRDNYFEFKIKDILKQSNNKESEEQTCQK